MSIIIFIILCLLIGIKTAGDAADEKLLENVLGTFTKFLYKNMNSTLQYSKIIWIINLLFILIIDYLIRIYYYTYLFMLLYTENNMIYNNNNYHNESLSLFISASFRIEFLNPRSDLWSILRLPWWIPML